MILRQVKGLVPAKNQDSIGLANEKEKKFYKLNNIYLQVWLLCNGKRDEKDISKEIIKIAKKQNIDIESKELEKEVVNILNRLLKFGLLEQ